MNSSPSSSLVQKRSRKRRRSSMDSSRRQATQRNKSIRLQQSISLNIPMSDMTDNNYLNCFLDMPQQTFGLTYLGSDDTLNPESLGSLEDLKKQQWQVFSAGCIFNFNNSQSDHNWLCKALKKALEVEFKHLSFDSFHIEMHSEANFCPTENDHPAISIQVTGKEGDRETSLYWGLMLSWCSPLKSKFYTLPVLLCKGNRRVKGVVHRVISDKLDVVINKLTLAYGDFICLTTYCLVMLGQNDSLTALLCYAAHSGEIQVHVNTSNLLKLWRSIHPEETTDVDLDTVLQFHEELEAFFECTYGIKFNFAHLHRLHVKGAFMLSTNSPMRFDSTKVGHVLLKFLTSSVLRKLKLHLFEKSSNETY